VKGPDFNTARQYALDLLAENLPPGLYYHSLAHTRDEVAPAAARLSVCQNLSEADALLLNTAVYYHDLGFTVQRDDHERVSAAIAADALPRFGYRPDQIAIIQATILVTNLSRPPQNLIEMIIIDSDLDVLGRRDYLPRNVDLRMELESCCYRLTDLEWYSRQYRFIAGHLYHTTCAQQMRNEGKRHNTAAMQALLARSRMALQRTPMLIQ
jgi:uncharacterized protein